MGHLQVQRKTKTIINTTEGMINTKVQQVGIIKAITIIKKVMQKTAMEGQPLQQALSLEGNEVTRMVNICLRRRVTN